MTESNPTMPSADDRLAALMKVVGTPGVCRGCDRRIVWVTTAKGRAAPYDLSGISHFSSCPDAAHFRKRP